MQGLIRGEAMFFLGFIFLLIGAVFVYGTKFVSSMFKTNDPNPILYKIIGLVMAIAGVFMILYGEFPKGLEFIKIF